MTAKTERRREWFAWGGVNAECFKRGEIRTQSYRRVLLKFCDNSAFEKDIYKLLVRDAHSIIC